MPIYFVIEGAICGTWRLSHFQSPAHVLTLGQPEKWTKGSRLGHRYRRAGSNTMAIESNSAWKRTMLLDLFERYNSSFCRSRLLLIVRAIFLFSSSSAPNHWLWYFFSIRAAPCSASLSNRIGSSSVSSAQDITEKLQANGIIFKTLFLYFTISSGANDKLDLIVSRVVAGGLFAVVCVSLCL